MTSATDIHTAGAKPAALSPVHRAAVSAAFFANGFLIGSWAPQIPIFAERLAISKFELGLMILAFGVGAVLAMPVVGRLIGTMGSRLPMIALHLALVLALPLVMFAPSVPLAAIAVLFMGLATGGMDVAMNASAVSVERRLAKAIMSSCHGFWSVGGLVGAGIGGFLIAGIGSGAHALLSAAIIGLCWFVVRHGALDDHAPVAVGEATDAASAITAASSSGAMLKAIGIGMFALFAMIPEGAAIDWSALYLKQDLEAGPGASGLAFAAFSATMAVLRFAGDGIRDRLGAVLTARLCSLMAVAGLLLVAFANGTPMAIAGFAVMGIGISNIVPIAFSAAGNVEGLKPGMGLSIVTTLGYSGILIAPSAIGFVAEHVGFPTVFASLALLLVVTFLAAKLVAGADGASAPAE